MNTYRIDFYKGFGKYDNECLVHRMYGEFRSLDEAHWYIQNFLTKEYTECYEVLKCKD